MRSNAREARFLTGRILHVLQQIPVSREHKASDKREKSSVSVGNHKKSSAPNKRTANSTRQKLEQIVVGLHELHDDHARDLLYRAERRIANQNRLEKLQQQVSNDSSTSFSASPTKPSDESPASLSVRMNGTRDLDNLNENLLQNVRRFLENCAETVAAAKEVLESMSPDSINSTSFMDEESVFVRKLQWAGDLCSFLDKRLRVIVEMTQEMGQVSNDRADTSCSEHHHARDVHKNSSTTSGDSTAAAPFHRPTDSLTIPPPPANKSDEPRKDKHFT
jgi:hypothetical protein